VPQHPLGQNADMNAKVINRRVPEQTGVVNNLCGKPVRILNKDEMKVALVAVPLGPLAKLWLLHLGYCYVNKTQRDCRRAIRIAILWRTVRKAFKPFLSVLHNLPAISALAEIEANRIKRLAIANGPARDHVEAEAFLLRISKEHRRAGCEPNSPFVRSAKLFNKCREMRRDRDNARLRIVRSRSRSMEVSRKQRGTDRRAATN
jgi:hypothetical protein